MRPRLPGVVSILFAAILAACTAGTGPARQLTGSAHEPAGAGEEPAGGGRESPGDSRDNAGGSSSGGSSGGSSGSGSCPPCDYVYTCVAASQIESQSAELTLVTQNRSCVFQGLTPKTL